MKTWVSATILIPMACAVAHAQSSRSDAILREAILERTKVAHEHGMTPADCEPVMVEGMTITFTNANGRMSVTGGKRFERHYTWAGGTRTVVMIPRKERWYGSLGMYNPGSYIPGEVEPWTDHDGIKRYVVEEGQRHFTNTADAVKWIQKRGRHLSYVYNDSGLVVGMRKSLPPSEMAKQGAPGTLSVDIWQVYINGQKPEKVEGSQNDAITVHYPPSYDMQTVEPPADPVDHDYCPFDASKFFKPKREGIAVLAATRALPIGHALQQKDLGLIRKPEADCRGQDYVLKNDARTIIGQHLVRPLKELDVFQWTDVTNRPTANKTTGGDVQ